MTEKKKFKMRSRRRRPGNLVWSISPFEFADCSRRAVAPSQRVGFRDSDFGFGDPQAPVSSQKRCWTRSGPVRPGFNLHLSLGLAESTGMKAHGLESYCAYFRNLESE